jgi:hypothetical protein
MEVSRISLNLMGIHPNPSERVETDPLNANAKEVWSSPVQSDFKIEQCALDGEGNNYRFIAAKGNQHVLLTYVFFFACRFFIF